MHDFLSFKKPFKGKVEACSLNYRVSMVCYEMQMQKLRTVSNCLLGHIQT